MKQELIDSASMSRSLLIRIRTSASTDPDPVASDRGVLPLRPLLGAAHSINLRDLEGEQMIVREQGSTTRRAFHAALEAADVRRLAMEISSREGIREP